MNELIVNGQTHEITKEDVFKMLEDSKNNQIVRRNKKTDASLILQRKGPKNQTLNYVTGMTVQRWLDENFAVWNFEIKDKWVSTEAGTFFNVLGKLTVYSETGLKREVEDIGCDKLEIDKNGEPVELMYWKAAKTDALKRCAVNLGGFTDVYSDEVLEDDLPSSEEIDWYIDEALPVLIKKKGLRIVVKNVMAFMSGKIKKTELETILGD